MISKMQTPTTNIADKVDEYRQKMVNLIANSEEIFHLVADEGQVFGEDDLVWTNIFPTEFVIGTQEKARTLVCVDVDINYDPVNNCYDVMDVYFFVSTHSNIMQHPDGQGLRVDAIIHEIRKLLDRKFITGLGVKKSKFLYNRRYNPTTTFRGRVLCMRFEDFKYGV